MRVATEPGEIARLSEPRDATMVRNLVLFGILAIVVAAVFAFTGDDFAKGGGQITRLSDRKMCLQPGDPEGNDTCYRVTGASELPDDLEVGDQITLNHERQRVVSVEFLGQR